VFNLAYSTPNPIPVKAFFMSERRNPFSQITVVLLSGTVVRLS
jgi:hypothetical protein